MDFMGPGISSHFKPFTTTMRMVPPLGMVPTWIIASVNIVIPTFSIVFQTGSHYRCIASIGEFYLRSFTTPGTSN